MSDLQKGLTSFLNLEVVHKVQNLPNLLLKKQKMRQRNLRYLHLQKEQQGRSPLNRQVLPNHTINGHLVCLVASLGKM